MRCPGAARAMAAASEGASSGTISSMKRMMQRRRSACDATSRRGDLSPSRSCEAMQRASAVVDHAPVNHGASGDAIGAATREPHRLASRWTYPVPAKRNRRAKRVVGSQSAHMEGDDRGGPVPSMRPNPAILAPTVVGARGRTSNFVIVPRRAA